MESLSKQKTKLILLKGPLHTQVFEENEYFIATIPALELSSFGYSKEQALAKLQEALGLFIEACLERGTLADVLLECGWKMESGGRLTPPEITDNPIPLEPFNEKIKQHYFQRA